LGICLEELKEKGEKKLLEKNRGKTLKAKVSSAISLIIIMTIGLTIAMFQPISTVVPVSASEKNLWMPPPPTINFTYANWNVQYANGTHGYFNFTNPPGYWNLSNTQGLPAALMAWCYNESSAYMPPGIAPSLTLSGAYPAGVIMKGSTAEKTNATINRNNGVRDLTGFQAFLRPNDTYVYFRIDVAKIPINKTSGKPLWWGYGSSAEYGLNATCITVTFDTEQAADVGNGHGVHNIGDACDTYTPPGADVQRELVIGATTTGNLFGYMQIAGAPNIWPNLASSAAYAYCPTIDNNNPAKQTWNTGAPAGAYNVTRSYNGTLMMAENTTANFIMVGIPKADFGHSWIGDNVPPWNNNTLYVNVATWKPGEMAKGWLHAFDPQAPGLPGEVYSWSDTGVGSDLADAMPGGPTNINMTGYTWDQEPWNGYIKSYMTIGKSSGPTAKFTCTPVVPELNAPVTFNASTSKPGFDGIANVSIPIVNYTWTFGDGTPTVTQRSPIITHRYTSEAVYNVTLTVTCAYGTPRSNTAFTLVYPTWVQTVKTINITPNGDLSGWAGLSPVYRAPNQQNLALDLQPWCLNQSSASIGLPYNASIPNSGAYPAGVIMKGSTAEKTNATITQNNEARELKALWVATNATYVFIRLDVAGLPSAFWGDGNSILNRTTMKPLHPGLTAANYLNASTYMIFFDTFMNGTGTQELDSASDTLSPSGAAWQRRIFLDNGTDISIQAANWNVIDDTNHTRHIQAGKYIIGNLTCGMNLAAGSFEMAIPRADFPGGLDGGFRIWVTSHKPGEITPKAQQVTGYIGNWTRAFDPQAPGTPGETYGVGNATCAGSDLADVMPGGRSGLQVILPNNARGEVLEYLTIPTISANITIFSANPGIKVGSTFVYCPITYPYWYKSSPKPWSWGIDVSVLNLRNVSTTVTATFKAFFNSSPASGSWSPINSTTSTLTLSPLAKIDVFIPGTLYPWGKTAMAATSTDYPYPVYNIMVNATGFTAPLTNSSAVTVSWPGDARGSAPGSPPDGKINGNDLYVMAVAWTSSIGAKNYDPRADFNMDGHIDGFDLYAMAVNWHRGPLGG
jgi:hypothetical protein